MEERTQRIGESEALFRAVNEQVESLSETFSNASGEMTIVCECGDQGCVERIEISPDEYREVRADPALFIIKPGHEAADVERVVATTDQYAIIRKRPGTPVRLAEELETRER